MNKSAVSENVEHKPWDIYKLPANTPGLKWAVQLSDGSRSVFRTKKQAEGFVGMCHPDSPGHMFRSAI